MNVGDIVKVKSGSPEMTLEYIDSETGRYHCVWFTQSGEKKSSAFHPEALEAFTPKEAVKINYAGLNG